MNPKGLSYTNKKTLVNNVECALQIVIGSPRISYTGLLESRSNLVDVPWTRGLKWENALVNSCEKPVEFWTNFLESGSFDLVLDLFAGTGSLSEAAVRLKLNCCAVEKDTKQAEFIKNRIGCHLVGPISSTFGQRQLRPNPISLAEITPTKAAQELSAKYVEESASEGILKNS